jgi:hypothetical protein
MKLCCLAVLAFLLATPAYADLTLKQTVSGKGLGLSGTTTGVVYIKGHRMRSDVVTGDKTQTTIFDLDAQKLYMFDSKKKEADVWDMAAFASEISKSVDASQMKVSLTPNGRTKTVAGQTAAGYDLEISMPAAMVAGSDDLTMTVTLSGPTWIVKGAPGTDDYLQFYKGAAEKGWILGDPRAAKASPGQARAMTEMYRQLAEAGGIAYETDMQIRMSAGRSGNPLGGLLARMGTISSSSVVQSVDNSALADDLFAPPAGYKLNTRK